MKPPEPVPDAVPVWALGPEFPAAARACKRGGSRVPAAKRKAASRRRAKAGRAARRRQR